MNSVFVYCEIEEGIIADVSLELLTKGRTLATELGVKLEAIVLGSELKNIEKQALHKQVMEVVELVNLTGLEERLPSQLSGGQQQRVALARALASKPAIIFADEPTGNLDAKSSKEVVDLLKIAQRKYHETVILVTHDQEIASIADRVITIEDGKIIQDTNHI